MMTEYIQIEMSNAFRSRADIKVETTMPSQSMKKVVLLISLAM